MQFGQTGEHQLDCFSMGPTKAVKIYRNKSGNTHM